MSITKLRPSFTLTEDRLAELEAVVPEAFADGAINWETLREALGAYLEEDGANAEHFGLFWPGKREARRLAALPSKGALHPAPGEGIDEGTTRNLFIEGDNLEVLRLLKKSYAGCVKMIYIDPPYNTGNDFVYKDDYSEPLAHYLRRTNQADEQGVILTTNTKAGGRFHSNWLNMMYPRLLLAQQLLRDDGLIFVSIDDNEAHNLRALMNEVLGEENYLTTLYIQVRYPDKTLVEDADFHKLIELVYVYRKSSSAMLNKPSSEYSYEKFVWKIIEKGEPSAILQLGDKKVEVFSGGQYEIIKDKSSPHNLKEIWATGKILDGNSSGRFFRDYLTDRFKIDGYGALYKVHGIGADSHDYRYFTGPKRPGATKGKYYQGVPRDVLERLDVTLKTQPINNLYNFADSFGNCRHEGDIDFRNGKKPIEFLKALLRLGTDKDGDDIVLDFFAGSCSTAHAVLGLNREDSGNRRFLCVQLPEPIRSSEVKFRTVADLGKERIRRVIRKMKPGEEGQLRLDLQGTGTEEDLGFRVFALARSTFKQWQDYEGDSVNNVETLFDLATSPLIDGWLPEDMVTEVLLLQGFPLDSTITRHPEFTANMLSVVASDACAHRLFVCLDERMHEETIAGLHMNSEDMFVCLDSALTDQAKMRLTDVCNLYVI